MELFFNTTVKSGNMTARNRQKDAKMLQDTVLMGGGLFLITGAIIWVLLNKVNASQLSQQKKRLSTYGLLAILIAVAIFVIDWHSSNYKANYAALDITPILWLS